MTESRCDICTAVSTLPACRYPQFPRFSYEVIPTRRWARPRDLRAMRLRAQVLLTVVRCHRFRNCDFYDNERQRPIKHVARSRPSPMVTEVSSRMRTLKTELRRGSAAALARAQRRTPVCTPDALLEPRPRTCRASQGRRPIRIGLLICPLLSRRVYLRAFRAFIGCAGFSPASVAGSSGPATLFFRS